MYKYLQFYNLEPNLVVDITSGFEAKMAAVLAHKSQFYNPTSPEPETVIASKGFLDFCGSARHGLGTYHWC
jgi:LmbE family N-acetylglucosaminyl deacetylase